MSIHLLHDAHSLLLLVVRELDVAQNLLQHGQSGHLVSVCLPPVKLNGIIFFSVFTEEYDGDVQQVPFLATANEAFDKQRREQLITLVSRDKHMPMKQLCSLLI